MHTLLLRLKWNGYTWVNDFLDFIALFLLLSLLFILFYFVSLFTVINFANLFLGHENFSSTSKKWKKMSPPIPPYKFFTFHPSLNWDVKKTSLLLTKWGDLWGSLQFTAFSLYMILRDQPENFTSNLNKFKRINSPLFFMETWLNQWLSNVFRRYRTKITREISSQ